MLHEDESIIVLNKPAGLLVHPAKGHQSGTLVNALAWHFQNRSGGELSKVGQDHARPGIVHRLDRHTSGVMVAAKNETAHWRLVKQFEERTVGKRYLAVVHGRPEPAAELIDTPLGPHPRQRLLQAVRHDELGKPAISIYRTLEQYEEHALVEVELKTGRTHQIRVHLSHRGYPLLGDDLYGGKRSLPAALGPGPDELDLAKPVVDRQALHATHLRIHHPISGEPMSFAASPPGDLCGAVRRLRRGGFTTLSPAGAELSGSLFD